jgi:large subunit ribosomal protein L3
MAIGLIGQKCGMTRLFHEDGSAEPVSVVKVDANRIVQLKSLENDGYRAVQITTGSVKRSRINKPLAGHYAKEGLDAGHGLWEFRIQESDSFSYAPGAELSLKLFEVGQLVDVSGVSIGKGFAGVVKRHNFRMQDATHGNSLSHRAPGSIGQNQSPGRVFKGKKMAGHMGSKQVTIQNLRITAIDNEKSLLMIKGAIPGPKGGNVVIRAAVKK